MLPAILGLLMVPFGRDAIQLAWVLRLFALINPVLMYFLIKRISDRWIGALAAFLVAIFGYTAMLPHGFTVDAVLMTIYLFSVLFLLIAVQGGGIWTGFVSGLLLGATILTKETALVGLPLALVAACLVNWRPREVLGHYVGVGVFCLPWWAWAYSVTGRIYLIERLPPRLALIFVGMAVLLLATTAWLAVSGVLQRLVANEQRRAGIAWIITFAWTAAFAVVLPTNIRSLAGQFRNASLQEYLAGYIPQNTQLWFLLPLVLVYLFWSTFKGDKLWAFYLSLLILWVPVQILVVVQRFNVRQLMLPQALLYGALAAMVIHILRRTAHRRKFEWSQLISIGVAGLLSIALGLAAASQVRTLLSEYKGQGTPAESNLNQANVAVRDMHRWISSNVPRGAGILSTDRYLTQLMFEDSRQHRWKTIASRCSRLGKGSDEPVATLCVPSARSRPQWPPPQPVTWFGLEKGCRALALNQGLVLRRLEDTNSEYLLLTYMFGWTDTLSIPAALERSGAFEIVHKSYLHPDRPTNSGYFMTLLKSTGLDPSPAPTVMHASSVPQVIDCATKARGKDYDEAIRTAFPQGIAVRGRGDGAETARQTIKGIYSQHGDP